jgi:acetyltransferase (GNAT) family protein
MTRGISIRTARAADYDGIISVVDDWWGRPVHHALPRLFLDHFHDTSFIAERPGGELAGFLVGFCSPAQRDCAYIQFAGVAPQERRSGLATAQANRLRALLRDGVRQARRHQPRRWRASRPATASLGPPSWRLSAAHGPVEARVRPIGGKACG